jgi:hypothetical protein
VFDLVISPARVSAIADHDDEESLVECYFARQYSPNAAMMGL